MRLTITCEDGSVHTLDSWPVKVKVEGVEGSVPPLDIDLETTLTIQGTNEHPDCIRVKFPGEYPFLVLKAFDGYGIELVDTPVTVG